MLCVRFLLQKGNELRIMIVDVCHRVCLSTVFDRQLARRLNTMDIPKVKPVLFTPFNDQYPERSDSRRHPKQGEPKRQQEREQDRSLNKSQQKREVGINVDLEA